MTIKAVVTWKNGTKESRAFRSFIELAAWMEHHFGEYKGVDAKQVAISEMRQGKEGGNEGHDDGVRG